MRFIWAAVMAMWTGAAVAEPVVVFAAASLKEPIDALAAEMGDVVVSYGGSGTLARQVMQGAPADVVLLANADWLEDLAGAVHGAADFASNELVLIGGVDAPDLLLADLPVALGADRLAIGAVNSVPAGIYGKAGLEALGIWDSVKDHLAEVDNVRAALVLVARGEVPYGVTYATDVAARDAVRLVARFPDTSHPVIRYVGGLVSDRPEAAAFWDALQGEQGQAILADFGFRAPSQ